MITQRGAPKILATPLATRFRLHFKTCSSALLSFITRSKFPSTYTSWTHGVSVSGLHRGRQVFHGDLNRTGAVAFSGWRASETAV
jgi:hypothetical protein